VDLYEQLPSDARPAPETELDFAREIQLLTKRRDRQRTDSEIDQEKIAGINKIVQPSLNFDLKVGVMLGLTNEDLASFNTFVAVRNRSSTLFLTYLQQLAETAKPEQTWLEGWRAFPKDWMTPEGESQHFDGVLGRLQELYNMCSAHLSPMEVTNLKVGDASGNYFVEAWQSFSRTEAIEKFTNDKKLADDNLQREQADLDLMPRTLDQVAEVRLFLVNANNRLEMIRFTGSGREKLP